MRKFSIFMVILATLLFSLNIGVVADDSNEDTTASVNQHQPVISDSLYFDYVNAPSVNMADEDVAVFDEVNTFFESVASLHTSSFYEQLNAMDNSYFNQLVWEVPTTVESAATLNYQYSSLLSGMYEIGYGEKSDLTIPEFEVGYSKSITERFTDTFGDLSHLQVSEVSLPEGWTFSEIMNEATASRNAEVAEFYDSEVYSSVSNRISIGDCFAAAQEGIEMPDIPSTTDLIANMLGASVYGKYKVKGEANNNFDIIDQAVSITTIDNSPGLADEMTKWWSDSFKVCTDSLTAFLEPDEEQQQTTDAADAYTGVYGGDVYVGDLPTDSYPSMDSEFVM